MMASKSTPQEVMAFRTTLVGVCSILNLNYRTGTSWTRLYKLRGSRGRKRYGLTQLFRFRLIAVLSTYGFSIRQIKSVLSSMTFMLDHTFEDGGYFVIYPTEADECKIFSLSANRFASAVEVASQSGRLFGAISLAGLANDVLRRVESFIDRKPCVSQGEQVEKALLELSAAKKREEIIHGQ
jgi:DNA-binding transcriptional MerR regulator